MISLTPFCSAQLATIRSARSGPTPGTSRRRAGSASITSKTAVPNASTSLLAKCGPTPFTRPEARNRSIPSGEVGVTVVTVSALNCGPCFGSFDPRPRGPQLLSGRDRGRVPDDRHRVAPAAHPHPQDGEARLLGVERHPLHLPGEELAFRRLPFGLHPEGIVAAEWTP